MYYDTDKEKNNAQAYFKRATLIAKQATCLRAKCGAIIVKDNHILGQGFNSPAGGLENQKRCLMRTYPASFKSDTSCCVHAEQRAIMDALRSFPDMIIGSRLYFVRLDTYNNHVFAGEPYCTICSRMALDAGIAEFVLWHKAGIAVYDTAEYNIITYNFGQTKS